MAIRGRTPGGTERVTNWTHDKVPPGEFRSGWLAGDVHVVPCHCSTTSRPCTACICGKHVACAACAQHKPVRYLGYVPLYRADGRPCVVVVREHQFEQLGDIDLHARVTWGRAKGVGETVWVRRDPSGPRWTSTLAERMVAADLCPWLCVLWRLPDFCPQLRAYLDVQCQPTVTAEPAAPVPAADVAARPAWVSGVQDAAAKSEGHESFEAVANRVLNKVAALPSRNGQHKKK